MENFTNKQINFDILKERAHNLRWAEVPDGVIPLTAADHDFPCAPEVVEALTDYIKDGYFQYIENRGMERFKEDLAKSFRERKNEPVEAKYVLPIDSAARGMQVIADAFLQPGDECLVFDPVDFLFRTSMSNAGATIKLFPSNLKEDRISLEGLENYITPKTKMIGFCNPHNPMGMLYTKEDLDYLLTLSEKYGFYIMNDEIWSDIIYSERPFVSINSLGPELNKKTISFYGFSKGFSMAGIRGGYLICPEKALFDRAFDVSGVGVTVGGVPCLTQVAMKAAFEKGFPWVDAFVAHLQTCRDMAYDRLNAMPGIHADKQEATFVTFFDMRETGVSSDDFARYILERSRVYLVPGNKQWFGPGAAGHVRLCYATSHAILREGLDRVERGVQELMNGERLPNS